MLAVVLAAAAVAAPPACSKKAATAAVVASSLPQRWKDAVRHKYGPYEGISYVICRDFTLDNKADMAVVFSSGGTAGDVAWAVFRATRSGWKLSLSRLEVYKVLVAVQGSDLVETQPVYLNGDPNCCPTGGYDHRRFHWTGRRFALARRWQTRR